MKAWLLKSLTLRDKTANRKPLDFQTMSGNMYIGEKL